jgi:hypothetical protein
MRPREPCTVSTADSVCDDREVRVRRVAQCERHPASSIVEGIASEDGGSRLDQNATELRKERERSVKLYDQRILAWDAGLTVGDAGPVDSQRLLCQSRVEAERSNQDEQEANHDFR